MALLAFAVWRRGRYERVFPTTASLEPAGRRFMRRLLAAGLARCRNHLPVHTLASDTCELHADRPAGWVRALCAGGCVRFCTTNFLRHVPPQGYGHRAWRAWLELMLLLNLPPLQGGGGASALEGQKRKFPMSSYAASTRPTRCFDSCSAPARSARAISAALEKHAHRRQHGGRGRCAIQVMIRKAGRRHNNNPPVWASGRRPHA